MEKVISKKKEEERNEHTAGCLVGYVFTLSIRLIGSLVKITTSVHVVSAYLCSRTRASLMKKIFDQRQVDRSFGRSISSLDWLACFPSTKRVD